VVWSGGPAAPVLDRAGIAHQRLVAPIDPSAALAAAQPTLLLTGTSWGGERWELRFLDAAGNAGIPSLSVIDFWSNYASRFQADSGLILPDRIAVPDRMARLEAAAEGLPVDRLVETGNPHYESLLRDYRGFDRESRLAFRERVGLPRTATVILFASQPIRALYGRRIGYTEDQVLGLVRNALEEVSAWLGHSTVLAVRRHPREAAIELPQSSRAVPVRTAEGNDPLEWALAADLVVGMTSALLLQTAALGGRAVSVQPGLIGVDRLPSNRLGLSDGVFAPTEVAPALYRALARPAHLGSARALRRFRESADGATDRLSELVVELGTTAEVTV
jgi:hypothetical protein